MRRSEPAGKRNVKNERIQCRRWPQAPKRSLRFLLSYGAMQPPVIYLLSELVGPFARHSSACPPQHMKASATAVRDGGKWVPDAKVLCVYVCVCVSCHIRECFYCTSGLSHIPRVMWGRLLRDGGGAWVYPTVYECTLAVHIAAGIRWTCLYAHAREFQVFLLWTLRKNPKTAAERILQPCNRQIASAAPHMCCVMHAQYSSKAIDYSAAKSFHPAVKLCVSNHRGYPLEGWHDPNGWRLTVSPLL